MTDERIFSEWVVQQMKQRKLTKSELSKRADLSRGVIDKVINQLNTHQPAPETCIKLARAFGVSQVFVFRLAKLITEPVDVLETSPEISEINLILPHLSPDAQSEILEIVRVKLKFDKK